MGNVIVLGGGAAGLMCALTAAKRGRQVLVLEKQKLLLQDTPTLLKN